jgi:regulator of replication initiation timing
MKNTIFLLCVCSLGWVACKSEEQPEKKVEDALLRLSPKDIDFQRKNDSLMLVVANYLDSMSILQNDLNEEKRKKVRNVGMTEMRRKLMEMEALLGRTQEQVNVLEEKLIIQENIENGNEAQSAETPIQEPTKPIRLSNSGLKKLMEQLKIQLKMKEQEVATLKRELGELKITVNLLQTETAHKEQVISDKSQELADAQQKIRETENKALQIEEEKAQAQVNELIAKAKIEEQNGDKTSGLFNGKKKKQHYKDALSFYQKAISICEKYNFDIGNLTSKIEVLNKKVN